MKYLYFNTCLNSSILSGEKTVTRRKLKLPISRYTGLKASHSELNLAGFNGVSADFTVNEIFNTSVKAPYQTGDIICIKETCHLADIPDQNVPKVAMFFKSDGRYEEFAVTADELIRLFNLSNRHYWLSPYYVKLDTARLFLEITNVRIERLQDITDEQVMAEGIQEYSVDEIHTYFAPSVQCLGEFVKKRRNRDNWQEKLSTPVKAFKELYDSTLKKKDKGVCDWESNPYVWVIEFQRVSREYALKKERELC